MTKKQIEKGTMYTINREMVVVETTEDFSNPLSYDKEAIELFLKNNRETLESVLVPFYRGAVVFKQKEEKYYEH